MPMTDRKLPLVWFLLIVIVSTVSFLPVQEAKAAPVELAYDDGTKEHQFYVSDQWFRNKAAQKLSASSVPFALIN